MTASRVGWFGPLRPRWKIRRLKTTILACQNGLWGEEPSGNGDLVCVRVADFDRVQLRVSLSEPTLRAFDATAVRDRMLQPGDLLLEKSGGGEKQPVGAVVLFDLDTPAVCSNFIARMRVAPGHDPKFLTYLHAAAYAAGVNQRCIKQNTGIQNLDSDAYLAEPAPIPPLNEQRAIAAFLDRETAEIDALIAKKERLRELFEEKRTALITRAVTKGLDPAVPMRDSGVGWLGEVPTHWEVKSLKRLASKIGSGKTPSGGAEVYVEDGVMLLRSQNVHFGSLRLDDVAFIDEATNRDMAFTEVHEGDVLLNITGASLGRCCVARLRGRQANVNQHVCIVRPRPEQVVADYLAAVIASDLGQAQIFTNENGISRDAMNFGQIGNLAVPVPPVSEQDLISRHIATNLERLTALAARVQAAIALLREYRTALISAAVTGRIDVSGEDHGGR